MCADAGRCEAAFGGTGFSLCGLDSASETNKSHRLKPVPPKPLGQILGPNRQSTNALTRGGKDGIAQRRSDGRHGKLARASRLFRAWHDVDFHDRHFIQAQYGIVVEAGLFDAASGNRSWVSGTPFTGLRRA